MKCPETLAVGDDFALGTLWHCRLLRLKILPKKRGERSDRFQVVLEEPTGGAEFNPDFDGGEECQRLTIVLENEIRGGEHRRLGPEIWELYAENQ